MPEAPEVQVIVDDLQFLVGREIKAIFRTPSRPWIVNKALPSIISDKIVEVYRLGKFIVICHESTKKTVIHLSFTGLFSKTEVDYLALKFFLDNGSSLYFSDRRGLSRVRAMSNKDFLNDSTLKSHKVDGLSSSRDEIFFRLLELKNRNISRELKPLLLDFNHICGIGNIYGSEICYEMKVNPRTKFNTLSDDQLEKLAIAIQVVLRRAYAAGGSSIETFSSLSGKLGDAQKYHKVYGKQVCGDCGSRILSFKQSGRTTYYCPTCQGGTSE